MTKTLAMNLSGVTFVCKLCRCCATVRLLLLYMCTSSCIWIMNYCTDFKSVSALVSSSFGAFKFWNLDIGKGRTTTCCEKIPARFETFSPITLLNARPLHWRLVQIDLKAIWQYDTARHCSAGRCHQNSRAQKTRRSSRHTLFADPIAEGQYGVVK